MGVEYDSEFVYVAVEVTDDYSVNKEGVQPWFQDGIEVRIDPRTSEERAAGGGDFQGHCLVLLMPGQGIKNAFRAGDLPAGIKAVCVKTKQGHTTEVAFPITMLNEPQSGDWKDIRLNVTVNDFDSDDNLGSHIWWQPDWRSHDEFAGAGTFLKE
jgi:hypothetical protein